MLPFALYVYITPGRTSNGATPYLLVYGVKVILPTEAETPSLRVIMEVDIDEVEWVQSRYDQLNIIKDKRLIIVCHGQLYQRRLKRDFDKKVHPRVYQVGELVLKRYSCTKAFLGGVIPQIYPTSYTTFMALMHMYTFIISPSHLHLHS